MGELKDLIQDTNNKQTSNKSLKDLVIAGQQSKDTQEIYPNIPIPVKPVYLEGYKSVMGDPTEYQAQKQSSLSKLGHGLANTATGLVFDTLKDISYLFDWEQIHDIANGTEQEFSNWFADLMDKGKENTKMDVFRTKWSQGFNPLSAGWWADAMPSLASSLSMMIPALGATKLLSGAGKILKGGELLKTLGWSAEKLEGLTGAVFSRYMENTMEGKQTFDSAYQQAINNGASEEEAKKAAGEAARNNWYANSVMLLQDIPQFMMLSKGFKGASKVVSTEGFKQLGKQFLGEGGEEMYQFITDKEVTRNALVNHKLLENDKTSIGDRLLDYSTDGDFWTSAFLGGLGGAAFGAYGVSQNYKTQKKFDGLMEAYKGILKNDPITYNRGVDEEVNQHIKKSLADGNIDKLKDSLQSLLHNPNRIRDTDEKTEYIQNLKKIIDHIDYAKDLHSNVMSDNTLTNDLKLLKFNSLLTQKSSEERLTEINQKLNPILAKDLLHLAPDIHAYKQLKLAYEGIKDIPNMQVKAKELEQRLKEVIKPLAKAYSGEKYNISGAIGELNKSIISSHDEELKKLLSNKEIEGDILNQTRQTIFNLNDSETRKIEQEKINQKKAKKEETKTKERIQRLANQLSKGEPISDPEIQLFYDANKQAVDKQVSKLQKSAKKNEPQVEKKTTEELVSFDVNEDISMQGTLWTDKSGQKFVKVKEGNKSTSYPIKEVNGKLIYDPKIETVEEQQETKESTTDTEKVTEVPEKVEIISSPDVLTRIENYDNPETIKATGQLTPDEFQKLLNSLTNEQINDSIHFKIVPYKGRKPRNPQYKGTEITDSHVLIQSPPISVQVFIGDKLVGFLPHYEKFIGKKTGKPIDIESLTQEQFLTYFRNPNVNLQEFKEQYRKSKLFYQTIEGKTELTNAEFKKLAEAINTGGKLKKIEQPSIPITQLEEFQNNGEGYVVYNLSTNQFVYGKPQTIPDNVLLIEKSDKNPFLGYIAKATLPNGQVKWVILKPQTKALTDPKLEEIVNGVNKVKELLKNAETKAEAQKIIADNINTFIATKSGDTIEFNVYQEKGVFKLIASFQVGDEKTRSRVSLHNINIKTIDDLIKAMNGNKRGIEISKTSFKEFLPKGQLSETQLSKLVTITDENILSGGSINIKFKDQLDTKLEKENDKPQVKEEITSIKEVKESKKVESKESDQSKLEKLQGQIKGLSPKSKEYRKLSKEIASLKEKIEQDRRNSAFKLSDNKAETTINLNEEIQWIEENLPDYIEVDDIQQIIKNLQVNGIPFGLFRDRIIYLNKTAEIGIGYHEAFHAVFRLLLSDYKINSLLKQASKEIDSSKLTPSAISKFIKDRNLDVSNEQARELILEEYLADKFQKWKLNRLDKSIATRFKNFFKKLVDFWNWLTNKKADELEQLFAKIDNKGFKYSSIIKNRFSNLGEAYKIIGTKNSTESEEIIATITAKIIENNKLSIDDVIKQYIEFNDSENFILSESLSDEETADYLGKLNTEYAFYNNPENQKVIKEQVESELKQLNFNPHRDEENEQFDELGERNFDQALDEIGGYDKLSSEVKSFITHTLIEFTDELGRVDKKVINGPMVFASLQRALSGIPIQSKMERIKQLSKINPEIAAVYNRLVDKTDWNSELNDSYFNLNFKDIESTKNKEERHEKILEFSKKQKLIRFLRAFEYEHIDHVQVLLNTENGTSKVLMSNQKDVQQTLFSRWANHYSDVINSQLQDKKKKDELVLSVSKLLGLLNNPELRTYSQEELNYIKLELSKIGLELSDGYIKFSFGNDEEFNNSFFDVRALTTADISQILDIIRKGNNPYSELEEEREKGAVGRIMDIAKADSIFETNLFESNFIAADGKRKWSFIYPNHIITKTRELSEKYTNQENLNNVDKYNSYNPLIQDKEAQLIFSNLKTALIGDIRDEVQEDGVTFKDTDKKSLLLTSLNLYLNSISNKKTKDLEVAWFYTMQPEAKSNLFGTQLSVKIYTDESKLTDETVDLLYNTIFLQEFHRLGGEFGKFKNNTWINLEFFNTKEWDEAFGVTRNKKGQITSMLKKELHPTKDEELIGLIKDHINEQFNDKITNVIQASKDLKAFQVVEGLFNNEENKAKSEKYLTPENFIANFYINHYINSTAFNQLLQGDLASSKSKIDRVKRNGGENASGPSESGSTINVVYTTEALKYTNKEGKDFTDKVNSIKDAAEREQFIKDNDLENINSDDAQVDITVDRFIQHKANLGELTKGQLKLLLQIKEGVKPNQLAEFNKNLYDKKNKIILDMISLKTVYYGDGIYHKKSDRVLTKNFTSYWNGKQWVARPGREALHNKREWMEKNNIHETIPLSASKLKSNKPINWNTFSNPEELNKIKVEGHLIQLDGKWSRKQLETASKGIHDLTAFVQAIQLIDLGSTNEELKLEYYKLLSETRKQAFEKAVFLLKKDILDETGKPIGRDVEIFLDKLRDNIDSTNPDTTLLKFLESEGKDFKYDSNIPHIVRKLEELFLAHLSKGTIQQNVNGRKFTLVSPRDFNIIENEKGEIITSEEFDKDPKKHINDIKESKSFTRKLKVHRLEGDTITHAEVAVTRGTAQLLGLKIGDNIPSELLEGFGVRIPTQLQHSMIPFKIVEFLPEYYGDSIIIPEEIIKLSGADFDIDSLYAYLKDFYVVKDEDGNSQIKIFGKEENDKYEEYLYWELKHNKGLNKKFTQALRNNIDHESYKKIIEIEKKYSDQTLTPTDEYGFDSEVKDFPLILLVLSKQKAYELKKQIEDKVINETFRELGLYTKDEFDKLEVKPQSLGAVNNRILDIYLEFMSNPEISEYMFTPATTKSFSDDSKLIEKLTGKSLEGSELHNDILGLLDAFQNNMQGKKLVGHWASSNTAIAWLTKNKISLNPEYNITLDGVKYDRFSNEQDTNGHLKQDSISSGVSSATDNAKERDMAKLNYSEQTTGTFATMMGLGIPRELVHLFANQPVLIEYNKRNFNTKSPIQPVSRPYLILNEIIEEYKKKYEEAKKENQKDLETANEILNNLPEKYLKQSLKSKEDLIYYATQLAVIERFEKMNAVANHTVNLTKLISTNRGITGSFENLDKVILAAEDLNLGELIGSEQLPIEKLAKLPYKIDKGIKVDANLRYNLKAAKMMNDVLSKFFIGRTRVFNEGINRFIKTLNPYNQRNPRTINELKNNYTNYFTLKAYKNVLDIKSFNTLNNLLYNQGDNTSVVQQFGNLLKKEEFRKNELVRFLKKNINEETITEKLEFNSWVKISKKTQERLVDAYIDLSISKDKEIAKFAKDMFYYLLIKDGFQFRSGSFSKQINPERFKTLAEATKKLNKALYNNEDLSKVTGLTKEQLEQEFLEIYARHIKNTINIFQLPAIGQLKKEGFVKKDNKNQFTISHDGNTDEVSSFVVNKGTIEYPEYLRIYNFNSYRNTVYTKISESNNAATYEQVSQFGNYDQSPYSLTPKENEELSAKLNELNKQQKAKKEDVGGLSEGDYIEAKAEETQGEKLTEEVATKLLESFATRLGVDAEIMTKEEAKKLLGDKYNDEPAFFYKDKVYLTRLNLDDLVHEFSHPFVDALYKNNNELFYKVLEDVLTENPELLDEVQKLYPEDFVFENGFYDPTPKAQKEILVRAITKLAKSNIDITTGKTKESALVRLWNAIRDLIKNILGINTVDIRELTPNTTLQQLADILTASDKVYLGKRRESSVQFKKEEQKQPKESKYKRIETFFERRIKTLEREAAKHDEQSSEYREIQKELKYVKEKAEKASKESNVNIYKELAEHTLTRVKAYLDELKTGKASLDNFKQLNFAKDVLDTFATFGPSMSEVDELQEELSKYLNQWEVKKINKFRPSDKQVTLEQVEAQDMDIHFFKAGTGSLSDLNNYRAATIGYMITTGQNEVSGSNKELFNEVMSQVEKLEKYAKSKGLKLQQVYDKLIVKNLESGRFETADTSNNQLSTEEREFLGFFQEKMSQFKEKVPVKFGRNYLPNVPKKLSIWEKLKKLKSRYINKKTLEEANTEDIYADVVGLKYFAQLNEKERSLDLGEVLYSFGAMSNNYKVMSEVLPQVRILEEGIKNRQYRKYSNPKQAIEGDQSNLHKMVKSVIDMQIKDKMKLDEKAVTSTTFDENGNEIQTSVNIANIGDDLLSWNSLVRIGLSPITAFTNVSFGDISNFIEAIGARFFTIKGLHKAGLIYWKQTFDKESTLNKLLEELGILQELDDYTYSEEIRKTGQLKGLTGDKLKEYMYSMQKGGEKWLQSRVMMAIMIKDGYLTTEGVLTDKYNKISKEDKEQLINKILRVNQQIHGRYTTREAATWYQSIWFRAVSQFRKWIPAAIESRFGSYNPYDVRLGTDVEGRYRTAKRLLWRNPKEAFENIFLTLFNNKKALESGKMTELELYNMRKNMIEATLLIALSAIIMGLKGGADKDKKKLFAYKTVMLILERTAGDINFWTSPTQLTSLTKNAVPATKIIEDLIYASKFTAEGLYSGEWFYEKGSHKGQIKPLVKLGNTIPFIKPTQDVYRLFKNVALEELNK